jgi:hypothetical protein
VGWIYRVHTSREWGKIQPRKIASKRCSPWTMVGIPGGRW